MESAGRRSNPTNYHELTGMASNKKDKSGVGSKRSASIKSRKSDKDAELAEIDQQLESLQDKLDSNPAYVTEKYEKVDKEYGTVYETEAEISGEIMVEQAQKLKELQQSDINAMDRQILQLKERQGCLDLRDKLLDRRREIEMMMWKQRIQEKEQLLRDRKRCCS